MTIFRSPLAHLPEEKRGEVKLAVRQGKATVDLQTVHLALAYAQRQIRWDRALVIFCALSGPLVIALSVYERSWWGVFVGATLLMNLLNGFWQLRRLRQSMSLNERLLRGVGLGGTEGFRSRS
jgi:hypothetical protein